MEAENLSNLSSGAIAVGGSVLAAVAIRRWWLKIGLIAFFVATGVVWYYANKAVQQKSAQESAALRAAVVVCNQKHDLERKEDKAERSDERDVSARRDLAIQLEVAPRSKKPALLKIAREAGWSTEHVHMKDGISASPMTAWGIPQDDFNTLSDELAKFGTPYERDDLIVVTRDGDLAANLAGYLANAFRKAGWNVPGGAIRKIDGSHVGVIIVAKSRKTSPPGAGPLIAFLKRYGIQPKLKENPRLADDRFQIIVGSRPPEIAAKMAKRGS
jgi:hypothetical protein